MKIISKFDLKLGNFILTKNKTYDCELYNDHSQSQYGIRIVSISYKNDDGSEMGCQFFSGILNAYFYNDKELRKLKLERINGRT
jgi:hypothetical protein